MAILACAPAGAAPLTMAPSDTYGDRHAPSVPCATRSVHRALAFRRQSPFIRPRNDRTAFATVAAWCLRIVGWHRLERLLASIPDSNDDFGLV